MSTFLYEHMIRVTAGHLVCRIWRQADCDDPTDTELRDCAYRLMMTDEPTRTVTAIARQICEVEGVNSVEIVDADGNGICIHKDWP